MSIVTALAVLSFVLSLINFAYMFRRRQSNEIPLVP